MLDAVTREDRNGSLGREIAGEQARSQTLNPSQHLFVGHASPRAVESASRDQYPRGSHSRPMFERVGNPVRKRRQLAFRPEDQCAVGTTFELGREWIGSPARRDFGTHTRSSPSARMAFCLRIRSCTSGLNPASRKSLIQRSGVISG